LQEFMELVTQHWNTINRKLQAGDVYLPILLEDEQGVAHANDWATGFMRSMSLRRYDWKELVRSEEHGGSLIPILALANEHHPDPRMRPHKEPMDAQQREKLITGWSRGSSTSIATSRRIDAQQHAGPMQEVPTAARPQMSDATTCALRIW
jgi:uncharacterized protein